MANASHDELENTPVHITNNSVWVASKEGYWDVGDSRNAALASLGKILRDAGELYCSDFTTFRCEEHVIKTVGWKGKPLVAH